MKYLRTFLTVLMLGLLLPATVHGGTLEDAYSTMGTLREQFQAQLLESRETATANNTQDLIDVGIHNLRILRAKLIDSCSVLKERDNAVNRSAQETLHTSCIQHAEQQYALSREIFRASMLQDMYLKKTSLYEARLISFNDHLRQILDTLIFIRGTITKVQKGIDGTASKTFTR